MIFCEKKFDIILTLHYKDKSLTLQTFLGVIFKYNGTFSETKKKLVLYFYCQTNTDNGSDTSYKLTRPSPLQINR